MDRLNLVGFESPFGYKTLELYEGDLSRVETEVDLLVVSVVKGDYSPLPGSLVESIEDRFGTELQQLYDDSPLDLTETLKFWISPELQAEFVRRVFCLEMDFPESDIAAATEDLFVGLRVAAAKKFPARTVAMPLVGAGWQAIEPEMMVEQLLAQVKPFLTESPVTERLLLVERDPGRAEVLADGINSVLKRSLVGLPRSELIDGVRTGILGELDRAWASKPPEYQRLITDLRRTFSDPEARSYEVGVVLRRLAEAVTRELHAGRASGSLYRQIEELTQLGFAKWIATYLHVLRVFGNEAAHESPPEKSQEPAAVQESDLVVCLVCAHRVLEFWVGRR